MAGTINSLGIGSGGVLSANVIDQLKANDTANMVTPIEKKIATQTQKGQALDLLNSLLSSFKSNINKLSDATMYQKRSVSGNNDGIKITATSGSDIQSFSISNVTLAKKEVQQSGSIATLSTLIAPTANASGTDSLTINIGKNLTSIPPVSGTDYTIKYTPTMTLEELKTAINDTAGQSVTASVLQTGGSTYNLILTSKETGADQNITLTDTAGNLDPNIATISNLPPLQAASDAKFTYNGIQITRGSNTIKDFPTLGVDINLLQDNASSTISISQNTQAIADELKNMITSYNTLTKQLDDMTLTDLANGKVGIFNGDNTIKSIKREITKMLTSVNTQGFSLAQYGIGLSQDGVMTFTQSEFDTQIKTDPTALESFFSGYTDSKGSYNEGVFSTVNTLLSSYTSSNGLMSTLTTASKNESKTLATERTRSIALLTARYDTMTARFAAYDSMISKLNAQFSSLNQQIQAMNKTQ